MRSRKGSVAHLDGAPAHVHGALELASVVVRQSLVQELLCSICGLTNEPPPSVHEGVTMFDAGWGLAGRC